MSTEAEIKRWVREERAQLLLEEQAACTHKQSGSLALGAGDAVVCDACRKEIAFDPSCRRPPKT
ncbi:hypothetical protein LCGC14_1273950 [marine sediment metagenome]|uniref:Uncharacterized protein n=1 Tax=marine sediment metagenome TaxID=412755 RepID=A0A0F9KX92_9ZZZZ